MFKKDVSIDTHQLNPGLYKLALSGEVKREAVTLVERGNLSCLTTLTPSLVSTQIIFKMYPSLMTEREKYSSLKTKNITIKCTVHCYNLGIKSKF